MVPIQDIRGGQALGDESFHSSEVGADVALAIYHEGRISADAIEQRLDKPLEGSHVYQAERDLLAEPFRESVGPLGKGVKLLRQVIREPRLQLIPVHLAAQPHDLPGHLAVLSVVVVGRDVGDNLDANRVGTLTGPHEPPSPVDSIRLKSYTFGMSSQDLKMHVVATSQSVVRGGVG